MDSEPDQKPISALVLLSGGLDSRLATCVLKDQGIRVHGISFESPFFTARRARQAADQLQVPLSVEGFTAELMTILNGPRHGFGAGMNPCIDCHIAMVRLAGRRMEAMGFHLIATGEVLDQRPMSQNHRSLAIVANESGYPQWLVRPLSAQLLPESEPERRGWVDRSRLLALHGKSRREQLRLAQHYGVTDFPAPAGGCCLTEPNYARRLRDLKRHEGLGDMRRIQLLKFGRHFRLTDRVKLIVGRDAADNAALDQHAGPDDLIFTVENAPGPTALLPAVASETEILRAAAICARYSDVPRDQQAIIAVRSAQGVRTIPARPIPAAEMDPLRVV